MFVYVYGHSTTAVNTRQVLQKRGAKTLEPDAGIEALAECQVALLFVDNLAQAEESLQPVELLGSMFKILIVTNPKLYPIYRRLKVELVILSRPETEHLEWLIADIV